jgi:two-component system, NarL family, nitrate/nitrite response regulator NarL
VTGQIERRADRRDPAVTRVAVVGAQPIVRHGLARILETTGTIELVASFAGPGDLGGPNWRHAYPDVDVVLCDLGPEASAAGLSAIAAISAHVPVLAISESGRPADILAAVGAGASGYLSKQAGEAAYATAIRAVAAGRFHLSAELGDRLPTATAPAANRGRATLSAREQETLGYIARGFTHAQTATRMNVSKATVDTYVARTRTKLGVGNKAELALAALTCLAADRRGQPAAS